MSHDETDFASLDFLWLELTSRCNLKCIHCYAESAPIPKRKDLLSLESYLQILDSAASLGCRRVQFIGGEPTASRDLKSLIVHAHELGYTFIEVFTNATRISTDLVECFKSNHVAIATSFYSDIGNIHDSITKVPGSHAATVQGITVLLKSGLKVRSGIVVMEENQGRISETITYLHSLGLEDIRIDRVRAFGRGIDLNRNRNMGITELCGDCWKGRICVLADGTVAPCIMSRDWAVGSVFDEDFSSLVTSERLHSVRAKIYQEVWLERNHSRG